MADLRGDSEEPQGDGVEAMEISGSSTSTVDTPLPVPEPVDDETDMQDGKLMALATHTHWSKFQLSSPCCSVRRWS